MDLKLPPEIDAALARRARRVIACDRVIRLSRTDAAFLMHLLDKPPAPNAKLRKAFRTYRKRMLDTEHSTFGWSPRPRRV